VRANGKGYAVHVRYLAIDLGDKRTGLAVGDSITCAAVPVKVLETPLDALLPVLVREIDAIIGLGPSAMRALVIGLPYNMDGTEGPRAALVRGFGARLEAATKLTVHYHDERLSSDAADKTMARSGLTHKQKKERRDALAAATVLGEFLKAQVSHEQRSDAAE
jgi:putative holliday junction resolvase